MPLFLTWVLLKLSPLMSLCSSHVSNYKDSHTHQLWHSHTSTQDSLWGRTLRELPLSVTERESPVRASFIQNTPALAYCKNELKDFKKGWNSGIKESAEKWPSPNRKDMVSCPFRQDCGVLRDGNSVTSLLLHEVRVTGLVSWCLTYSRHSVHTYLLIYWIQRMSNKVKVGFFLEAILITHVFLFASSIMCDNSLIFKNYFLPLIWKKFKLKNIARIKTIHRHLNTSYLDSSVLINLLTFILHAFRTSDLGWCHLNRKKMMVGMPNAP